MAVDAFTPTGWGVRNWKMHHLTRIWIHCLAGVIRFIAPKGQFMIRLVSWPCDSLEICAEVHSGHNVWIPITNGRTEMATEDLKARLETLAQTITQYQVRL